MSNQPSILKRLFAKLTGSGSIAQGDGAVSSGKSGVSTTGDIRSSTIITGDGNILMSVDPDETNPDILKEAYLRHVIYDTGFLSLEGIDPKSATSEYGSRMNLGSVYTALLTQSTSHDDPARNMEPERHFKDAKRLSALAMLNEYDRLVLLGDPGGGKSTFINFVGLCMAGELLKDAYINIDLLTSPLPDNDGKDQEERQPWRHGVLLPVRVILRDFAASECFSGKPCANALWTYIENYLSERALSKFSSHLEKTLRRDGGILLLDGMDEIPEAEGRRERMKQIISEFTAGFGKCRVVLTSRTYAYQKQDWKAPGFHETVLLPFMKGQIVRFIERWYVHVARLRNWKETDAMGKAELLKRAVLSSNRLRELAERPLLLTLMAGLHSWRGGTLPEKREELYADTVDLLLDRWEENKVIRSPDGAVKLIQPSLSEWLRTDRKEVRFLLNRLAYQVHASQPDLTGAADIPEGDLVAGLMNLSDNPEVNPKKIMEHLRDRAGLLMPRGVGVYSFPHRTFQEYLAGCYLTEEGFPEKAAELARTEPDRWREVALLAGAKAASGAEFSVWSLAEHLCFKEAGSPDITEEDIWGAHIAAQAIVETARIKQITPGNINKRDRIVKWLLHIIEGNDLTPYERAHAGRNLAVLGDPRPEAVTVDGMRFCCVPAGPFIMGSNEYDDEKPVHENDCLNYPYWMGKYPVTNAQYNEFVKDGGYANKEFWGEAVKEGFWKDGKFKGQYDSNHRTSPLDFGAPFNLPNHPVVGVTWYEALAFTRWLTHELHDKGLLDRKWNVRLPSEAEWEKAARGGIETPKTKRNCTVSEIIELDTTDDKPNPRKDREYPWGEDEETDQADSNKANYDDTNIGTPSAVGCFPGGESPYGCLEMSGNVWEWTRSLWGKDFDKPDFGYPYKDRIDERENLNADGNHYRVLRGGSYDHSVDLVRCAYRLRSSPNDRYWDLGFRVLFSPNFTSGL